GAAVAEGAIETAGIEQRATTARTRVILRLPTRLTSDAGARPHRTRRSALVKVTFGTTQPRLPMRGSARNRWIGSDRARRSRSLNVVGEPQHDMASSQIPLRRSCDSCAYRISFPRRSRIGTREGGSHMENAEGYERRWWILGVLCLSLLVIGLDNTILNVALPTLVRDLGASTSQLQWIVDAYTLIFAGLLLTAGSLSDRFGRRTALATGLVIFGAGSLASAFAGSASTLILTRA